MTETAAYPSELEDHIVLPNRRTVHIRPLRRCEEEAVRELSDHLSPRTGYLRFFSSMPRLPDYIVRMLAGRLLRAAEARGFHRFIANVRWDSVAIRKLLKRLGDVVSTTMSGGTSEYAFVRRRSQ